MNSYTFLPSPQLATQKGSSLLSKHENNKKKKKKMVDVYCVDLTEDVDESVTTEATTEAPVYTHSVDSVDLTEDDDESVTTEATPEAPVYVDLTMRRQTNEVIRLQPWYWV